MFGFLKDKLKGALKVFSQGVEEKGKTESKTVEVEEPVKKPAQTKQIPPKLDIKPKILETAPKKDSKKTQEIKKDIKIKKEKILVEEIDEEIEELDKKVESPKETSNVTEKEEPVIEVQEPESKKIEKVKPTVKEEPKSMFSKFTSLFNKKDEEEKPAVEKKKERPKMVVESIRATSDGKIVEEKTIIQTKTPDQEDEEERAKAEQLKAQQEEAQARAQELAEVEALEIAKQLEEEKKKHAEPEKKSFFAKLTEVITTKTISQSQFEELFFDLEMAMLENNVAVQVIEKLKTDLEKNVVGVALKRGEIETIIVNTLRDSITDVLSIKVPDLLKQVETKKPYIIAFIGVNGAGKTTNLAKVANYLKKNGKSVVIAACDTFRAAAIQQLEEHANRLDIKIIKHDYGADAAAVAFDAVAHAKSKGIDVVLIDTAGRLHSNSNLMDELAKIERVIQPDLKLFVGESVTGNDCIEQAMQFNEKIGIDGIILSKADVDEKGGAAISVSYVTKKPIYFIGTGQTYDDLEPFDKDKVLASLEL